MSQPGYIYAFEANDLQNNSTTQMQVTAYDYPDRVVANVLFFTLSGNFRALSVAHPAYELDSKGLAVGVHVSGQGTFTPPKSVGIPAHFHVHAWKNSIGMWIQAEVYDSVTNALLWATGSVWPSESSSAVKLPSLQILLPK